MQVINIVENLDGKFGPQVKDDKGMYYSFSKFYKGKTTLMLGSYTADVYMSVRGNKYINSLEEVKGTATSISTPVRRGRPKKVDGMPPQDKSDANPAVYTSPKPRDFDAEARGKTRCALLEALYSNPNIVHDGLGLVATKALVIELADWGLKYVFQEMEKVTV